jgi:hypothetical protein
MQKLYYNLIRTKVSMQEFMHMMLDQIAEHFIKDMLPMDKKNLMQ